MTAQPTPDKPTDDASRSTSEAAAIRRADEALPPVEPPTATFILQLFLIPLAIVSMVVLVWLMFSWMAHMGRDNPATLVSQLRKMDDSSWQRAYELAELIRSPDPAYAKLRKDEELATNISSILANDLKYSNADEVTEERVKNRVFLCRAIGAFEITTVLPALLEAAIFEQKLVDVEVRIAAVEGLATMASNPQVALTDDERAKILATLLTCSQAKDDDTTNSQNPNYIPHGELRAVAAYGLGVMSDDEATKRLKSMLADSYASARYNAATGLARRGDVAAIPVLKEMLDPENNQSARDESNPNDQDGKRVNVVLTGIQATLTLHKVNPDADISVLVASIDSLREADFKLILSRRPEIQSIAIEAHRRLTAKPE